MLFRSVRLIVGSATYRQVSTADKVLLTRDPYNRELARQSRFRLDAETVRDNALAISGLLSLKIGGPSVKPYQPDRYWENLNFPVRDYAPDKGESQYRRGLYTWWQRSFLHPSMLAFDAPSREECTAERTRSNIPQQALVLLNDPTYVEAARVFEEGVVTDVREADVGSILGWGFAPYSGGTLSYIDMMGTKAFVALCRRLEQKYGPRFAPPKLLLDMAAKGDSFYGRFAPGRKAA